MIPIRDVNPTTRTSWITLALIAANVVVFLLWQPTLGANSDTRTFFFFYCNALVPWEVTHQTSLAQGGAAARDAIEADLGPQLGSGVGAGLQQRLQQRCPDKDVNVSIPVSMFLHGGWLHIAGNMLFLWIFGNNVEDRLKRPLFIAFYFLGGLAATALQLAFGPNSTIPNVGASGAIAAVLGAYLVLFPRARVYTLVFFFFITAIELPAVAVLGLWFVLQLFSGVGSIGADVNSGGVAYWAHVGGFAFGAAITWLFFRGRGDRQVQREVPGRPDFF
ncbi:MAG TPA: rhomboid family intramembrane serine protease [Actinomycetota bacterium]|nr:rhomboid family intramembrane serine protease [Actinomycetota bacterium]